MERWPEDLQAGEGDEPGKEWKGTSGKAVENISCALLAATSYVNNNNLLQGKKSGEQYSLRVQALKERPQRTVVKSLRTRRPYVGPRTVIPVHFLREVVKPNCESASKS